MNYVPPVKPKNWLIESILATIFCCLPFGVAGIVFAAQVDNFYAQGQFDAAENASRQAEKWTKVSFFVAIGLAVLYGILLAFGVGFGLFSAL